jgi:predicted DNA-binding transcriptional regulator AlpA
MSKTSPTKDRYLNKTDIAKLLNCSQQTVMRMAKSGELPKPVRFSHKMVRWRESDIAVALLKRNEGYLNVVS